MICQSCGNASSDMAKFCQFCGAPAVAAATHAHESAPADAVVRTCPSCGHETGEGATFCRQCGTKLGEEAPAAASTSAPVHQPVPDGTPAAVSTPAPVHQPVPDGVPTTEPTPVLVHQPTPAPVPNSVPAPSSATMPMPTEKQRQGGPKPLHIVIPLVILAIGVAAFFLLRDSGMERLTERFGGEPSATTETAGEPNPEDRPNRENEPNREDGSAIEDEPDAGAGQDPDDAIPYIPGEIDDSPIPTLRLVAVLLLDQYFGGYDDFEQFNPAEYMLHVLELSEGETYSLTSEQMNVLFYEVFSTDMPDDTDLSGFEQGDGDYRFQAPGWQGLTIHITSWRENQDFASVLFAATHERNGARRLLGQFTTDIRPVEGGIFTSWQIAEDPKSALALELSYSNNIYGAEWLNDFNHSTIALVPNEEKNDAIITFTSNDGNPFNVNGIEFVSGVHDTRENYDAYAQPTAIEGYVMHSRTERFFLEIDICGFQEYPAVVMMPAPFEDITEITFFITESSGLQEHIAIGEINIF